MGGIETSLWMSRADGLHLTRFQPLKGMFSISRWKMGDGARKKECTCSGGLTAPTWRHGHWPFAIKRRGGADSAAYPRRVDEPLPEYSDGGC